jgi:cyclophilin family peptidyl-prolyl cis-trans isomerase
MAASGEVLLAHASDFDNVFTDSLLLVTEIRQLSGTESSEAKQSLSKALAALTTFEFVEEDPADAKMLDWQVLQNISNSPLAIIVTAKGRITVELIPQMAPATVANFIQLTDENFYDQKHIHRVVANFVVQGGCPRDDGYGSLEYSIRSELPDLYYDREGYMGMASIGNHTESSQWFITHSPTPHLDGRYTIFGKVSEGMDVVHSLRIGDIIQDIRILKYN